MKSDLKVKYLQYLNKKKANAGFTLIELLVVIIIIGILSAIALPAFLNQANKAKQSEAKTNVGSMNRAQQAYLAENNDFVTDNTDFAKLGLGIATQTPNYKYIIEEVVDLQVVNRGEPVQGATAVVKAYAGGVEVDAIQGTGEATTVTILCEANQAPKVKGDPGTSKTAAIDFKGANAAPECKNPTADNGYTTLSK